MVERAHPRPPSNPTEFEGRVISYVVGAGGALAGLVLIPLMWFSLASVGLLFSGVAVFYLAARSKKDDRLRLTLFQFAALLIEIICIGVLVSATT